jgi:VanZ family protein
MLTDRRNRLSILQIFCLALAAAVVVRLFAAGAPPLAEPWDKFAHFALYALAAALFVVGTGRRLPFAVAAALIGAGACDELHRVLVQGQGVDALTFLADASGALGACAVMACKRTERRSSCAESSAR